VDDVVQPFDLSHLVIEAKLGEGVYSDVYLGRHPERDTRVAIKVSQPPVNVDQATMRRRFGREASILARLSHPLLPRIFEVGEFDGRPYLVMEYVEGRSLARALEEGPLEESAVCRIGASMASGLAAIHRFGILHRDLKPENIIWDGSWARLVDFGLADRFESQNSEVVGTLAYSAPEQTGMLNRPVDRRADFYSLGCVLFECATGRVPFPESEPQAMMRAHVSRQPPDVRELAGGVSAEFAAIIRRLLSKEPTERFASGEDLFEAFQDIGPSPEALPRTDADRVWTGGQADGGQLGWLYSAWDEVRLDGAGFVVEIEGIQGAGTSLLLERFLHNAKIDRGVSLWLEPTQRDKTPLASLRQAARSLSRETLENAGLLERLKELTEEDDEESVQGLGQSTSVASTAEQWSKWLTSLAKETGGLLLAVEEIDSVGESTAGVLKSILSEVASAPIMVVGSTHNSERLEQRLPEFDRLSGSEDYGHRIVVEPMTLEETAEFVQSSLGGDTVERKLVERLHTWSGGHRVATREFLQLLLESLALVPNWGVWKVDWDQLGTEALPEDLQDLFRERLSELSGEALRLCQVGAVWGDPFPLLDAGRIAGIADRKELLGALEAAESADVLEVDFVLAGLEELDFDSLTARFSHSDYREISLEVLGEDRVARLHGLIGRQLAERERGHRDSRVEYETAYHLSRAEDAALHQGDFGMCLRAARWAVTDGAFHEGYNLLETADTIAETYRLGRPSEYWFIRAKAAIQLGRIAEARRGFQRAEVLADQPRERARYRVVANGLLLGTTQHAKVEQSTMEVLELLDAEPPASRIGLLVHVLWMALWLRWAVWWDRQEPSAEDPERQRLLTRAYQHYSFAAVLGEKPLLGFYINLSRVKAAYSLGFSAERATAFASIATVFALAGWPSLARLYLEKSTRDAEKLDDRYANARAELTRNWVAHIAGEPLEAARRQRTLLETDADELPFHERSMAYEELMTNLVFRGQMREVLELFEEWESLRADRATSTEAWGRPYGLIPMAASFLGKRDEAERCLELGRRQAESTGSRFLRRTVLQGELVSRLEWGEDLGEPVDRLIDSHLELGADPDDTLFWFTAFFFYWGYARVRQWEAARRGALDRPAAAYREDLGRAVRLLEKAADDHPSFLGHARVLRAYHDRALGQTESAGIMAAEAERIATRIDNRWVTFEVARLRAHLHHDEGPNWNARQAHDIAVEEGWVHRAEEIRDRFQTARTQGISTSRSGSFHTGGEASRRSLDMQRTLDALLSVSLATAASVDPDAVCRKALRTSMDVFGAQRGLLFLTDDSGANLDWSMGFDAEGGELSPDDDFSRTVVERVRDGREPIVVTTSEQGEELGAESIMAHGIRSIMAAPLVLEDALVGVIYLDNRMAHGVFTHEDVEVLRAIASHVPVAIETARKARLEVEVESERSRRQLAERLRSYIERINGLMEPAEIIDSLVGELESIDWARRITAMTVLRTPPTVVGWERGRGRFDCDEIEGERETRERWWEESEVWTSVARGQEVRYGTKAEDSPWIGDPLLSERGGHWVGIPLSADESTRGLVVLEGGDDQPIDSDTVEQVLAFTSQTGVALESTRRAIVDALTGVLNRGAFVERAEDVFEQAVQRHQPLTVFVADLDEFKAINDTYGHGVGDTVLQEVAQVCNDTVRLGDVFGRHGGEEFVGVLPNTSEKEGVEVAERLRNTVADHVFSADGEEFQITISLGVAGRRPSDETFDDVFDHADGALYAAKEAGRDRVMTPE
jgi:diguanylate cyclase (GGDEF)-like protein